MDISRIVDQKTDRNHWIFSGIQHHVSKDSNFHLKNWKIEIWFSIKRNFIMDDLVTENKIEWKWINWIPRLGTSVEKEEFGWKINIKNFW